MSVTLEVLHVPDCPNVVPLVERLREATDLPVTTREITSAADAAAAGMTGSPTLLINGRDPFPTPILQDGDRGMSCRIYRDEHDEAIPAPSVGQLGNALAAALSPTGSVDGGRPDPHPGRSRRTRRPAVRAPARRLSRVGHRPQRFDRSARPFGGTS